MMKKVIEVQDLKREYVANTGWLHRTKKSKMAVDGIDFFVNEGEIFGLLGENGAGKTTTIKMLITLLAPTEGKCKILQFDSFKQAKKIRPHINFVFGGEMGVYRRLSAKDNLLYFAGLYKLKNEIALERTERLLKLVGLEEAKDQLVETYSKGMVQRLQIARGLINDPKIIFMDEPTVGLDPVGANMLRDLIRKMKEEGRTVLLTTHYMQEADDLCDRIGVLNHGKIVALDTPESLKIQYQTGEEKLSLEDVFLAIVREQEA